MSNMRTIRVTGKGQIKVKPDTTRITMSLEGIYPEYREQKTVCIWLSRKESSEYKNEKSPILTPLFEGYRKRAYHIAVFMSGSGDLYDSMLGLLLYNRRKMAEKELGVQWPRSRG